MIYSLLIRLFWSKTKLFGGLYLCVGHIRCIILNHIGNGKNDFEYIPIFLKVKGKTARSNVLTVIQVHGTQPRSGNTASQHHRVLIHLRTPVARSRALHLRPVSRALPLSLSSPLFSFSLLPPLFVCQCNYLALRFLILYLSLCTCVNTSILKIESIVHIENRDIRIEWRTQCIMVKYSDLAKDKTFLSLGRSPTVSSKH